MSEPFVWQEKYAIGVDIIDKEHQKLFRIVNKLFAFQEDKEKSQWACREGIKYFKEHAIKHFADEERYMTSIQYAGLEAHRRIHNDFRKKTLPALEAELDQMDYAEASVHHFLGVCAGWLIGHTLTEDQAIIGGTPSKWANLLSEEEHNAMRDTILELLHNMFQLESQVISESYGGEKFGKGIYHRLVYETSQGQKWEIVLAFEERLIINTVGKVMGIQTDKLDTMLINAARYTSRQFVGHIKDHFPDADLYELKQENLLNHEQLQKIFDGKPPQFSLLFDTGEGYFAFCVFAPHLLQSGMGTPIQSDNALEEIGKYLKKREKTAISQKKKILVVDDSSVIREMMKTLLESDYEVGLAGSGLSALRSIILDRPDLIVLDYEMPVCDGMQVLEMIRAEEDFADISVIFFTGRTDRDTIKKVAALKPAGYLSKYLKPEEIKQNIDNFFKKLSATA